MAISDDWVEYSSHFNSIFNASTYLTETAHDEKLSTYILILFGVIFLTWWVQLMWKRRHLYIYSWNLPGPFSFPIIGAGDSILSTQTCDIMETTIDFHRKYPNLAVIWFGPKLFTSVTKPEHIEAITTNPNAIDKDDIYKFLSFGLGEGLLTAGAEKWKKHRKIISPAFNQKILNTYQEIFVRQAEIFAEQLRKNRGNKELDLCEIVSNCTLDIIFETALGTNTNHQTSNSDFFKTLNRILEITSYRLSHIWHHLTFTWNWYPISKEYAEHIRKLKDFIAPVIRKKVEVHNNKQHSEESIADITDEDSPKERIFLDILLEKTNFTEQELFEEVLLILLEGSDTTATTLCSTFTMLGMFQDVQKKVLEEILEIIGPDRKVLVSDLSQMKYTERVIKETLRLFPVVPIILRKITQNIDAGDVIFPAGSSAFIDIFYLQRNPKYWTDPLKFDPDRFLPENVTKRHPCSYIPFSHGPRNCIGARFAMMNMKTILATVLRRIKIFSKYKTIEEINVNSHIVIRMRDGPEVWVERR